MTKDQRDRVELMATGDPKWDLSPKDIEALRALLHEWSLLRNAALSARPLVEVSRQAGALSNVVDDVLRKIDRLVSPSEGSGESK